MLSDDMFCFGPLNLRRNTTGRSCRPDQWTPIFFIEHAPEPFLLPSLRQSDGKLGLLCLHPLQIPIIAQMACLYQGALCKFSLVKAKKRSTRFDLVNFLSFYNPPDRHFSRFLLQEMLVFTRSRHFVSSQLRGVFPTPFFVLDTDNPNLGTV